MRTSFRYFKHLILLAAYVEKNYKIWKQCSKNTKRIKTTTNKIWRSSEIHFIFNIFFFSTQLVCCLKFVINNWYLTEKYSLFQIIDFTYTINVKLKPVLTVCFIELEPN